MKNRILRALVAVLVLMSSCTRGMQSASPADYETFEARVSNVLVEIWEKDVSQIAPILVAGASAQDILDQCRDHAVNKLKFKIAYKNRPDGFSTTVPGLMYLTEKWDSLPLSKQAELMCHETVHAYTETRLGIIATGLLYLTPEGRLGFEITAYAVSRWVAGILSGECNLLGYIDRVSRSLKKNYYVAVDLVWIQNIIRSFWLSVQEEVCVPRPQSQPSFAPGTVSLLPRGDTRSSLVSQHLLIQSLWCFPVAQHRLFLARLQWPFTGALVSHE